jgi:NAD(P)H-flavin reductase/NAD-dependent dihydropyrimidine dehydrogenase PreA subunit
VVIPLTPRSSDVPFVGPAPDPAVPIGFLVRPDLQRLIDALHDDGRRVIGPTIGDGAIVYDEVSSIAELPAGWRADQAPGRYRLERRGGERLFDYVVGPTAWKRFTFPPRVPVMVGERAGDAVTFTALSEASAPITFLGVRACELAAIEIQDRVLASGPAVDADYASRRASVLVVAVECVTAATTCFCTSMGTGPEVRAGFDLALTELDDGFLVRAGTLAGAELATRLPLGPVEPERRAEAAAAVAATRRAIGDPVATEGLPARLLANLDNAHWAEIAERCLACANCTLVCPTCFCTSVGQRSDLDGLESVADRTWDSCFTLGFSRVAGGNFRPRVQDRYRQWLTHKFATWWDQFGTSGCVGCGRCVTWCPVGIDVRDELYAIAGSRSGTRTAIAQGALPLAPAPSPTRLELPRPALVETVPGAPDSASSPPAPASLPQAYTTCRVVSTRSESPDTTTLVLADVDPAIVAAKPGQFVMAALPAFSPAPISISRFRPDGIELTIRAAGPTTTAITRLARGDELGLRGPLGTSWPVAVAHGRDVVIVTGGIGLAPLRPLIDSILAERDRFGAVRLYYGARTWRDQLFGAELDQWAGRRDLDVGLTVDRAGPEWLGRVGVVTHLFDRATWDGSNTIAFVCGPERMMQATVETLEERWIGRDRIWVTLERHMECGVGLCGHCQMGRYFVCRDGPVFNLAELGDTFGREGI